MNLRGMPANRDRRRTGKAGVVVAWLIAVVTCSSSAAPTRTGAPTAGAPSGSRVPVFASPTASASDSSSRSHSPSQGPTETVPPPASATGWAPVVTLSGPFGSVDREPAVPGAAWPDASGLQGLDTYVHSAPLTVTLLDPDLTFAAWTISATPAASPGSGDMLEVRPYPDPGPELLSVTGPSSGDWLLRADLTSAGRAAASYFWHLSVPDRDPPADGHVIVPAPRALLATVAATVTAVPGSGCYVDTCSDVGRNPPLRELEQFAGASGSTLKLTLSDASRFVRWDVSVRPVGNTAAEPTTLDRGRNPAGVEHATFAAPGSGDWYVSIAITFDRRRGSYTWFTRLTIP